MIVTFYSFKGGVGRSMALANVAEVMRERGLRVLMVDFDLEAPGLERFFDDDTVAMSPEQVQRRRGVMELLASYKDLRSLTAHARKTASGDQEALSDQPMEPLAGFAVTLRSGEAGGGTLSLVPAGRRAGAHYRRYGDSVRELNWTDFFIRWDGERFFDWFRTQAETIADIVLVDSRTGITELAGVCTFQLADVVVMLVGATMQSLDGCELVARSLEQPALVSEGRHGRQLRVLPVPARVDSAEGELLDAFAREFERRMSRYVPQNLHFANSAFLDLKIPYIPYYGYRERIAVRERGRPAAGDLVAAYTRLATAISQLAPAGSVVRERFTPIEDQRMPGADLRQSVNLLPSDIGDFTGRATEVAHIVKHLQPAWTGLSSGPPVVVVSGLGGIGKSALVVHVAHQLRERFPDGVLYVDMQRSVEGSETLKPPEVIAGFLRAIGVPDNRIPKTSVELTSVFRSLVGDRRFLLVVDNAQREADVRHLLPASAASAVLITCRADLPALASTHVLRLDVLSHEDSVDLFTRIAGPECVAGESDLVERVVELCGHLPLALRIAARKLSMNRWRVGALLAKLRDERRRLEVLHVGDLTVRAAFQVSYQELPSAEARMFRLLGLLDVPDLSVALAAVLAGVEYHLADAMVEQLAGMQLVDSKPQDRFRVHSLLRLFARELLELMDSIEERDAALGRALEWYCVHSVRAGRTLSGTGGNEDEFQTALDWFDTEYASLVTVVHQAHRTERWAVVRRLAAALVPFFELRAHWSDWRRVQEVALDAARRTGDMVAEGQCLTNLGLLLTDLHEWDEAGRCLEKSLELARATSERRAEAQVLTNLSAVYRQLDRREDAFRCLHESLETSRQLRDRFGEAHALSNLGIAYCDLGRWEEARSWLVQSLGIRRQLGDRTGQSRVLNNLGNVCSSEGRWSEAAQCFMDSLELLREIGDRHGEGQALNNLGVVFRGMRRWTESVQSHDRSLEILRQLGDHYGEAQALNNLGIAYGALGRWVEAVDCQRTSLALFTEAGDRAGQCQVLNDLAGLCRDHGRLEDAVTYYERCLDLLREAGDQQGEARTLSNLGAVWKAQGKPELAQELWRSALLIFEELGSPEAETVRSLLVAGHIAEKVYTIGNVGGGAQIIQGDSNAWIEMLPGSDDEE